MFESVSALCVLYWMGMLQLIILIKGAPIRIFGADVEEINRFILLVSNK